MHSIELFGFRFGVNMISKGLKRESLTSFLTPITSIAVLSARDYVYFQGIRSFQFSFIDGL